MENNLHIAEHDEFGKLAIVMIGDKPYFPATACAERLGYRNPQKAIRDHCRGVTVLVTPSAGGSQRTNYIPEGDLYRLIIRSKLPSAQQVEAWVFDEVLSSIRRHGAYITAQALQETLENEAAARDLLNRLERENRENFQRVMENGEKAQALEAQMTALAPKVLYYDRILDCANALSVSVIAKDYGISAVAFNKLLYAIGIRYRVGKTWLLYQPFANRGYVKTKTFYAGGGNVAVHTYWTQKGRFFLYDYLKQHGVYPQPDALYPPAQRIKEISDLQKHISNYSRTREVYR